MKHIPMTAVESTQIKGVGYDPEAQTLSVQFHARKENDEAPVYHYFGVPADAHEALMSAKSKGQHLGQNIKGQFAYAKFQPDEQSEAA